MAPVHFPYHCRNISTSNLEHLEHFDPNGIMVHPCKLLIIVHGCYTHRRPLIAIVALVQFFKIQVSPVHLPYHSINISMSNFGYLEHFDPNGIIVHPCKPLIIVHGCYTLRRPLIAIVAVVQFFKIQVSPVYLPYHCRYISTSNLEHLEHFDPNGIIVHPCKLLIIVHGCYTLRRPLITIVALVQFFKMQVAPVHLPCDSRNISTSNLEHLEHFNPNGIIVHPCKLLIIVHGCYTLRRLLIAIVALLQFLKIQVAPVHLPYDSRKVGYILRKGTERKRNGSYRPLHGFPNTYR